MYTGQLFSRTTQALFYNYKQLPIQWLLGFDFAGAVCIIQSFYCFHVMYLQLLLKHISIAFAFFCYEEVNVTAHCLLKCVKNSYMLKLFVSMNFLLLLILFFFQWWNSNMDLQDFFSIKKSSPYWSQICIMLCADHGPCVSGTHIPQHNSHS